MPEDPIKELNSLLTSKAFSRQNAEKVARVCYDAARLVYERQKQLKKLELKAKDVSAVLVLADTLQTRAFRFVAEGNLTELFGGCDEKTALDYFEKRVMGTVTDKFGRHVVIDEDGMRSLYKDPETGAHEIESDHYEEVRGKRLPWIKHCLENSGSVYLVEESLGKAGIRRTYLYTATATIKLHGGVEQTSYYVVIVREGKLGRLRFITAFSMFEREGFLHTIAMGRPYVKQS
jgi:hypothetical protein